MSWRVEFNAEWGGIHTVFRGTVTKQDSDQAIVEALSLAPRDRRNLFLTDLLDAETRLSTLDIYETPRQWEAAGANRANKLAIVVREGGRMWEDAQFYENTCRHFGWSVRAFSCQPCAIDWLTSHCLSNKLDAGDD